MTDASVCEGAAVAGWLEQMLSDPAVAYVHLHNAKRGCFSCVANRGAGAGGLSLAGATALSGQQSGQLNGGP